MNKLVTTMRDLHNDTSGAAFIEYTVLLGVILAVTIAVVVAVGGWASGVWATLNSTLPAGSP